MKALVLAGGCGTRLRPITYTTPKQLVPVANKPLMFYGLEAIADAGLTDVGVVVGGTAPQITAAVGDGSRFGLHVTYIEQDEPRGLAHAVLVSRDFLGEDSFVMYLGDNFVAGGIAAIVGEFQAARPDAQLLLARAANPASFGVAEIGAGGRVSRLEEKPEHPASDLVVAGVYIFGSAMHEAVRSIRPSARGELEITDAIQWLIDANADVRPSFLSGYWKDAGQVPDVLDVNRHVLESIEPRVLGKVDDDSELTGRVQVLDGAEIRRSRIAGPVIVGEDTVVADSYLGPFTSLGRNCHIERSEIESSIVLPNTSISGASRIEASLIWSEHALSSGT